MEALQSTKKVTAFTVFERVFRENAMPCAIRTDNGVPFASPNALFNLSKLPVWWLKQETAKPAGTNFPQHQAKFDGFIAEFNTGRPHQALGMKPPAALYTPSRRADGGLPDLDDPLHGKSVIVTTRGRLCLKTRKINPSQVFAGQRAGIKPVEDRLWLVSSMDYDLGYFDDTKCRLKPLDNP